MAKNDFKKQDEQLENVNEALSVAGQWINDNQNVLSWAITAVVAVVIGVMAIHTYVIKPKSLAASNENAKAVVYLMQGDYDKALNGDDAECIGFEAIVDKYHFFQAGKLAALYAGVCHFEQGDMEQAAKYLKKFSAKDLTIDPAAHQLLGDAYVELGELDKAVSAFKAAADSKSELIAPISLKKMGLILLEQGNKKAAKKAFESIKADYPASTEAQDIEKYIALAELS